MSDNAHDSHIPRHAKTDPGAEITMRRKSDGSVTVSFSDGSNDLNVSRREFMRISGVAAAAAAATTAGCRNPTEPIVPYVDRPEQVRIGQPSHYTSVCNGCATGCGVLVQTRAGRPVKLEGNPEHPVSRGALCARGQSSYLELYDPDRAQSALRVSPDDRHTVMSWDELDQVVIDRIAEAKRGAGVAILTRTVTGSARRALLDDIVQALPRAKHYAYEPLTSEAALKANEIAYGQRNIPHYRFDRADLVVSLGSDFLGTWLSPVEFSKQFSARRDPDGDMSRLIAFEGMLSLTGANADERYRVRTSHLPSIAMALAHRVVAKRGAGALGAARRRLGAFSPERVAALTGIDQSVLDATAQALIDHAGKSIVVAGGTSSQQPWGLGLEAAVNLLNAALGNDGKTIERARPYSVDGRFEALVELAAAIEAGDVSLLIIDGANPVYDAPEELAFARLLEKVPFVVSTSDRVDETAIHADYLATGSTAFEVWGDSNPYEGVYAIQQPTVRPLYRTRAFEESLLVWFGATRAVPSLATYLTEEPLPPGNRPGDDFSHDPGAWYRYLRSHWERTLYPTADTLGGFDAFWEAVLRRGVWTQPGSEGAEPVFRGAAITRVLPDAPPEVPSAEAGDLSGKELHLFPSVALYDGRFANNGHLQELPDPVTRISWHPYIMVSPRTFKAAGLELGQNLTVTVDGRPETARTFPVVMQPGMHDDVVAIPLGYGRYRAGAVGNADGVPGQPDDQNAWNLSRIEDGRLILSGLPVALERAGTSVELCIAQGAHVIDTHKRDHLATTTLRQYQDDPESGIHKHPPLKDLWEDHNYHPTKWGMSIDMTKCTGCSACVTACQEENNIPVVGPQGVREGREMHWMRIDRYYKLPDTEEVAELRHSVFNDPMYAEHPYVALSEYMDNPRVLMQPMLCQHCENAPCETVCPVLATMHSGDGLNQMAYNRCVGTRYCANNCPFKVRRFNWYNYAEDRSESFVARLFPEVADHGRLNAQDSMKLAHNPEVTVRTRGVMEKCTFCVQRIRRAKWQMREEGRSTFREGDVVTACQQTCPTDAIQFGNLLDDEHTVTKNHRLKRALSPLSQIGVNSSVAYLTSVWNTESDTV